MTAQAKTIHTGSRGFSPFIGLLLLLSLAGCSSFEEFNIKKMNFEVFRDPEQPLEVIRHSQDGRLRARALRCLHEPLTHGGTKEEQDVYVSLLTYSASHEAQPWCRIAAIEMLRRYKDPRAAEGLKEAYYRAGSFNPETATMIRCQALTALAETKQPQALEVLVRVLREPPVEGPDQDRELKMRERITAARALGEFKDYQSTHTLVEVLRKEEDDALRNNAHQSLVRVTGRDLPADAQVWADFLHDPNSVKHASTPGAKIGDRILELTGLK